MLSLQRGREIFRPSSLTTSMTIQVRVQARRARCRARQPATAPSRPSSARRRPPPRPGRPTPTRTRRRHPLRSRRPTSARRSSRGRRRSRFRRTMYSGRRPRACTGTGQATSGGRSLFRANTSTKYTTTCRTQMPPPPTPRATGARTGTRAAPGHLTTTGARVGARTRKRRLRAST